MSEDRREPRIYIHICRLDVDGMESILNSDDSRTTHHTHENTVYTMSQSSTSLASPRMSHFSQTANRPCQH